ncbi:FKBP-type peptidyl-prolyl cis-trans isomerase [Prevotella sp. DNF00663]|uniref:FKBP-type peptidyl-prolyl cis-trans isomerase n=1 Tax=Prevotella sp. DNF00663 TaxID=1384078 RepID=UPI0007825650|nr:FKBP-type peptidyl-prolyl cis-trans isomerase [Prevotella sp. DNF00663]
MKKTILLSIALLMGAQALTLQAKDKKKKKTTAQPVATIKLATPSDSVSYAAGMAATQGLLSFIKQQYEVDTTYMADFVQGFRDALSHSNDPKFKAYNAGGQIANMVNERIITHARTSFEGTRDSISQDMFHAGFIAALTNDTTYYTVAAADKMYRERMAADQELKNAAYKKENADWLARNATKEGVIKLPSGLQYKVLKAGTGAKPTEKQEVTVKYVGKLIDGTEFDNSYNRNPQTTSFRCNQVIKGWTEALTMMPVGSKWELFIPQELGYGERQAGKIKPYSTLVFTVELVGIKD